MSLATFPHAASTAAMESVRVPSYQHTERVRFEGAQIKHTHHVKQDSVGIESMDV